MFQFRQFPTYAYGFSTCYMDMTPCGFPHSDIPGSMLICSSPRLFAAYHVFHRLPVPRHSPCALLRLTVSFARFFLLPTRCFPEIVDSLKSYFSRQLSLPNPLSLRSFVQFSRYRFRCESFPSSSEENGGLKWTRTTDLALIRRAL